MSRCAWSLCHSRAPTRAAGAGTGGPGDWGRLSDGEVTSKARRPAAVSSARMASSQGLLGGPPGAGHAGAPGPCGGLPPRTGLGAQ